MWCNAPAPVTVGREAGVGFKPGGYSGGMRQVEWKSGRAPT